MILANNTKASDVKDSKSKIVLSLKLSRLQSGMKFDTIRVGTSLRCAVSSVEDHGYLVSTGIPNVNGFVKFEECEGWARASRRTRAARQGQYPRRGGEQHAQEISNSGIDFKEREDDLERPERYRGHQLQCPAARMARDVQGY